MKRSVNFGGMKRWRSGLEPQNILATYRALGMSDDEIKASLLRMKEEQQAQIELCAKDKDGELVLLHGATFTADEVAQHKAAIEHYGLVQFTTGMRVRIRNVTKQQVLNILSKVQP